MNETALSIRGLVKRYPGFTLGPLSLDVPYRSIVGFIGENGAGKSTTIRAALDITHADEGSVRLFGQPLLGRPGICARRSAWYLTIYTLTRTSRRRTWA